MTEKVEMEVIIVGESSKESHELFNLRYHLMKQKEQVFIPKWMQNI